MKKEAVIVLFRDSHFSCIEEYIKKRPDVVIITSNAYLTEYQKKIYTKYSIKFIVIDEFVKKVDESLSQHAFDWFSRLIDRSYQNSTDVFGLPLFSVYIKQALTVVMQLEKLHNDYDIKLCLFNDASLLFVKVFTEWTRKNQGKCIYVDHGTAYGEYAGNIYKHYVDDKLFADHIIVADSRSKETYAKLGIPEDMISVLGSPAYESHFENAKKSKVLSLLSKNKLKINKTKLTIGFATTWFSAISCKFNSNVYEETITLFINAIMILYGNSVELNVLIKDRHQNIKHSDFLKNIVMSLNNSCNNSIKVSVCDSLEDFLFASDIVVSHNSTMLFESIMYKKLAINIISISSLFVSGDVYESDLGIIEVQSSEELAEILFLLLSDKAFFNITQEYQYNYLVNSFFSPLLYNGKVSSRIADLFVESE